MSVSKQRLDGEYNALNVGTRGTGVPPCPGLDGVPHPPVRRQSSIASTYYVAGGMPLAFTQEDFLVKLSLFVDSPFNSQTDK